MSHRGPEGSAEVEVNVLMASISLAGQAHGLFPCSRFVEGLPVLLDCGFWLDCRLVFRRKICLLIASSLFTTGQLPSAFALTGAEDMQF